MGLVAPAPVQASAAPRIRQKATTAPRSAVAGHFVDVAADAWDAAVGLILLKCQAREPYFHSRMVFWSSAPRSDSPSTASLERSAS